VLTIWESSLGAFLLSASLQLYIVIIHYISFISYTCWVPTISVFNFAIFPCQSNLLLRRWWWRILQRGVLGLHCPDCFFYGLWSLLLFCFTRADLVSNEQYLCNNYTLSVIVGYLWMLYVYACGINDHGHTCDEYLVLFAKSGMTSTPVGRVRIFS
jgi:hypothetical protein